MVLGSKQQEDALSTTRMPTDVVQAELVDPVGVIAWLRDFLTRHPLTMRCPREPQPTPCKGVLDTFLVYVLKRV